MTHRRAIWLLVLTTLIWGVSITAVKGLLAPRREHSRKPEEAYGRIERLLPGPYLELFARQSRPGWDSLGDQPGLFDRGPVATRRRPSREPGPRPQSASGKTAADRS